MPLDLPPGTHQSHCWPPGASCKLRSRGSDVWKFEEFGTYLPQQNHDRELVLYNAEFHTVHKAYETDALRLGIADPYLAQTAQCISNGGWHGIVDSLLLGQIKDLGEPGIIPYVPEEFRGMVRYVLLHFCSIWIIVDESVTPLDECFAEGSISRSHAMIRMDRQPTTSSVQQRNQGHHSPRCQRSSGNSPRLSGWT